jgi:hypothetical protein
MSLHAINNLQPLTSLDSKTDFDKKLAEMVCRKIKDENYCQDIQQEIYLKILINLPKISQADNISDYKTITLLSFFRYYLICIAGKFGCTIYSSFRTNR